MTTGILRSWPSRVARLLLRTVLVMAATPVWAASSVLIWPVDPSIASNERAAALWLENRGSAPVTLQARVFAWQQDGGDQYHQQSEVIGSPPMMQIAPGERQLVRLTRTQPVAAGEERAYRVIIDEIPVAGDDQDQGSVGVKFQMRYSVPLFSYGEGLVGKTRAGAEARAESGQPRLGWRVVDQQGKRYLEIANRGNLHARITRAEFVQGTRRHTISDGLLGYVLVGSEMRWPLPEGVEAAGRFEAAVNGGEIAPIAPYGH